MATAIEGLLIDIDEPLVEISEFPKPEEFTAEQWEQICIALESRDLAIWIPPVYH